jgi:hypothetical protein
MRALLPRPGEVNDDSFQRAEQEYWVTTKTVLALLLLWKSTRRDLSMRAQINAVASTFLQACAPVEACAVPSPQSASGAELAICEVGFDEQLGQCVCVSLYTADLEEVQQNDTPQVIFWHALLLLHRRRATRVQARLGEGHKFAPILARVRDRIPVRVNDTREEKRHALLRPAARPHA